MRWLVVIALSLASSIALAKPRAGVMPVTGEGGDKVGAILVDALEASTTVVGPREVEKAMTRLGLEGELDARDIKKLQAKLGTAVVVQGKVVKAGKKRTLTLGVFVRGKKPTELTLQFKSTTAVKFREDVSDLVKQIAIGDASEDEEPRRKPGERRRVTGDPDDKDRDDPDDDDTNDNNDKPRKRRRKATDDDDEPKARAAPNPLMRAALRLEAGGSFNVRRLTYDTTATTGTPPPVGTGAVGARVEGEVYPFAFGDPSSPAAGLGFTGDYDKTVGLSIRAPTTTTDVSIDQAHYSLGARYRIAVGADSNVALGVAYARRHYLADRSMAQLDMPDVDYTAIAPGVTVRVPATPTVAVFGSLDILLMLSTGAIQQRTMYGPANVVAAAAEAGADIALTKQLALRLVAEYSQINFSFKTTAGNRGVTGATDRTIGLAATLVVMY